MSNTVITSSDIQVRYEKLYKFLMEYLWEFSVVQEIADLELAIFKRFPDKAEMQRCLNKLKLSDNFVLQSTVILGSGAGSRLVKVCRILNDVLVTI